jgi:hypothetical protein
MMLSGMLKALCFPVPSFNTPGIVLKILRTVQMLIDHLFAISEGR